MALWQNNSGEIIVGSDGKAIECDHCPCSGASCADPTLVCNSKGKSFSKCGEINPATSPADYKKYKTIKYCDGSGNNKTTKIYSINSETGACSSSTSSVKDATCCSPFIGFGNPADGKWYANKTLIETWVDNPVHVPPPHGGYTIHTAVGNRTSTYTVSNDCEAECTVSGTIVHSYFELDGGGEAFAPTITAINCANENDGTYTDEYGTHTVGFSNSTPDTISESYTGLIGSPDSYDNEDTTDDLKTRTLAAIDDDSTWADGGCYSFAHLDSTETSYSATKLIYHFDFTVPASKYYKITWDEVFTPESGSPTVTHKSWTFDDTGSTVGAPESSPDYTIDVPSSNGTTTIENIVISCLRPS